MKGAGSDTGGGGNALSQPARPTNSTPTTTTFQARDTLTKIPVARPCNALLTH